MIQFQGRARLIHKIYKTESNAKLLCIDNVIIAGHVYNSDLNGL